MHDAVPHQYADRLDQPTGTGRLRDRELHGWPEPEPPRLLSAEQDDGPADWDAATWDWDPQRSIEWDRHRLCGPERPKPW